MSNMLLTLKSTELNETKLQDLTRELCITIKETGIEANLLEQPGEKGNKTGLTEVLGTIVLPLISSGGILALIGVFKAFIDRGTQLDLEVTKADGSKVSINSRNISSEQINNLLEKFLDAKEVS